MSKSVVVIGTLDTKGDQFARLAHLIEERGHRAIVMDVGVLGDVPFPPAITREEVAKASGSNIEELRAYKEVEPKAAMDRMAEGASTLVKKLYERGELDGVVAGGGSMGTALALEVMKVLPDGYTLAAGSLIRIPMIREITDQQKFTDLDLHTCTMLTRCVTKV